MTALDLTSPDLSELFDPATLWRLLPSALPGRVARYLDGGESRGFIQLLAQVQYPNGAPMTEVYCKDLYGRNMGDTVLFGLSPASEWERQKKNQPNLMEATGVRDATDWQISDAVGQVDEVRANRYAHELQRKIASIDAVIAAEKAKIQTAAQDQETRLKKIEADRLAALDAAEKKRLAILAKAEQDRLAALEKIEKDRLAALEKTEKDRLAALEKTEKDRLAALAKTEKDRLQQLATTEKAQAAVLDERDRDLKDREARLDKREVDLQAEVNRQVGEKVGARELELGKREETVTLRENKVAEAVAWVKEQQEELEGRRGLLAREWARFKEEGGERFIAAMARLEEPEAEAPCEPLADNWPPPPELITQLAENINAKGYRASPALITRFLLSTCVAAATGQFVVLTGPTGVGKTSLINVMASALDARTGTVPVRPAWLDPTDLLGFYNPQCGRFQPTPFMDKLLQAQRLADANRLYLMCLDEMNLSRVENYAADFLALLEKARAGMPDARLSLYAREVEDQLRRTANHLRQREDGAEEFRALVAHLERYPARKEIPANLVVYGTINVDESTYTLSPKFLDRSLVTQITPPTLGKDSSSLAAERNIQAVWGLGLGAIRSMFAGPPQAVAKTKSRNPQKQATAVWQDFVDWQQPYLEPLGIRPGYRFAQVFNTYMRAAGWLNIPVEQAASAFFHAKLLPWVSFHRQDAAIGQRNTTKLTVLQRWAEDAKVAEYNGPDGLKTTLQALAGRDSTVIRYLE